MNFDNIDAEYEQFVSTMKTIGLDWKQIKKHGIIPEVMLCLTMQPSTYRYQPCFKIGACQPMANGQDAIEFAIWAGIYTGIQGVKENISNQVKTAMKVIAVTGSATELRFALMAE